MSSNTSNASNSSLLALPAFFIPKIPQIEIKILTIYYSCIALFGSFGNCITLLAILKNKDLQTLPNYYIFNLSLSDLGLCIIVLPISIVTLHIPISGWTCEALAFLGFIFSMMSVLNLGLIAFNRYILICHSYEFYLKIFAKRNVIISIIGQWVFLPTLCSFPLFGYGKFGYNPFYGFCAIVDSSFEYILAMDILIIYPPLILTLLFYLAVYKKFLESRRAINNTSSVGSSSKKTTKTTHLSVTETLASNISGETYQSQHGQERGMEVVPSSVNTKNKVSDHEMDAMTDSVFRKRVLTYWETGEILITPR